MKKLNRLVTGFAILLCVSALAGCRQTPKDNTPKRGDANWVDYVNDGSVKLELDYKNRDFYKDGIGEVTLKTCIDGDTAHFNPVNTSTSNLAIKSRFYGIDTPESTGRIQEWGKPASNFTKEKLKHAAENGTIVVSSAQSNYGVPIPDSTGTRYVSLIWINDDKQHADFDELYLLNLAIVQEGYSWVKNVQDMPEYADTFYAAERQAQAYKLNLFSDDPDPLFNYGEFEDTSLLDLKYATEQYILDPEYQSPLDGAKVRIRGTVAGFSDGTMYLQSYFSEEESRDVRGEGNEIAGGEYAAINIFCGMSAVPSKYKKINTYIELCVTAVYSENFGFQLTGAEGHFPIVSSEATENDCHIILTAEENLDDQQLHYLEYTSAQLNAIATNSSFECLNCAVKVTDSIECESFYINDSGEEITLRFKNIKFSAFITFPYAGDPTKPYSYWNTAEDFVGKKFFLEGIYTYHKAQSGKITYQIIFNNVDGLVWDKPAE